MAISRKLIGILTVSAIGLVALSASAQNANDDASRKADPKKTSGYSWGASTGNGGYVGTQNQRKKTSGYQGQGGGVTHDDDWRERSSKGYNAGGTWVSGDPNQRKKESGGNAKDKVGWGSLNEVYISRSTDTKAPSTLPAGSNEWTPPNPGPGNHNVVTNNKHPEVRTKAKTKSRRRN